MYSGQPFAISSWFYFTIILTTSQSYEWRLIRLYSSPSYSILSDQTFEKNGLIGAGFFTITTCMWYFCCCQGTAPASIPAWEAANTSGRLWRRQGSRWRSGRQPYSYTSIQPYSYTAIQPYSHTAIQSHSHIAIQLYNRKVLHDIISNNIYSYRKIV